MRAVNGKPRTIIISPMNQYTLNSSNRQSVEENTKQTEENVFF